MTHISKMSELTFSEWVTELLPEAEAVCLPSLVL
jgi:hypothetical protein